MKFSNASVEINIQSKTKDEGREKRLSWSKMKSFKQTESTEEQRGNQLKGEFNPADFHILSMPCWIWVSKIRL